MKKQTKNNTKIVFFFEQANMFQYLSKKVSNYKYNAGKRSKMVGKGAKSTDTIQNVENMTDKVNLLKTLVVSNETMGLIKSILTDTAQYRAKMVKQTKLEFLEQFPMFFTNPELVSFDTFLTAFHTNLIAEITL